MHNDILREKNLMIKTIRSVVCSRLCTGCGTCFSMCPSSAITIKIDEKEGIYLPEINEKKCNLCGVCFNVCPGHRVHPKTSSEIKTSYKEHSLIGKYLKCYIGYSNDPEIRYNSSSGGLVTQLLIYALKKRLINGAIVTKMKKDKPLEPEPFLATTPEQIVLASKSKYCPVPANTVLREVIKRDGRFAVVGLPCHINGIRNAELHNKILKSKIVLHLGLFCSHTVNFLGTKFLLERFNINEKAVKQLDYRGMGWPGSLSILLFDGRRFSVPLPIYWRFFAPHFFTPPRCMICYDQTNENADLSFGDAWLKEVREKEKIGRSIIISRNNIGEALLNQAESEGFIALNEINIDKVVNSQRSSLCFKKYGYRVRIKILRSVGKIKTSQSITEYPINLFSYPFALFQILSASVSQKRSIYKILKFSPSVCIKGWNVLLYYLERFAYRS